MKIRSLGDVSDLPTLTKKDIFDHHVTPLKTALQSGVSPEDIKTPLMTGSLAGAELWTTSGSSGMPTVVVRDHLEYDYAGYCSADALKVWLSPKDKVANLMTAGAGWGTSTMTKSSLNHAGIMTQLLGNKMPFDSLAETFEFFQFNCVYGLPSWCAEFFSWLENSGKIHTFPIIDKLILGGESPSTYVQTDQGPKTLSEYAKYRWGGKIISLYGGTEIGTVGLPLTEQFRRENKFHIIENTGHTELVNEQGIPLRVGDTGVIITSRFINALLPLIRFETNDRGVLEQDYLGDETGLRGFAFPKDGCRADDTIKLTSQNVYGFGTVLDELIRKFQTTLQLIVSKNPNIAAGQSIQINTERLLSDSETKELTELIISGLKQLLKGQGKDIFIDTITFNISQGISMGRTGKFQRVINME